MTEGAVAGGSNVVSASYDASDVDLTNCDREPIQIPGAIQPHGVLLAFDPASLRLAYVSENFGALAGIAASQLIGRSVDELVNGDSTEVLRDAASRAIPGFTAPVSVRVLGETADRRRMGMVSFHDGMALLEAELESDPASSQKHSLEPTVRKIRRSTARIESCASMDELYRTIAEEVRELNGFDRVMVYRFLRGGHGAVVGEAAREGLESYLGLHYPATDIPQQARRLYKLNTLRLIADVNALSVAIVADPAYADRPLDLTHSVFRSVSPIHLEYLRNMGVAASMSISILYRGELWGLIACHHYAPRYVPLEIRAACELLGAAAGSFVTARNLAEEADEKTVRRIRLAEAAGAIATGDTYRDGIKNAATELMIALNADGLAICGERTTLVGFTPPHAAVSGIREALLVADEQLIAVESLAETVEGAEAYAEAASGALLLRSGPEPDDALIFFRREYATVVNWAGNPHKPIEQTEDGARLSPRKSFATWQQTARLRSKEWTTTDLQIAREMLAALAVLSARRVAEILRVNDELARMNADLNSFAFSVSHDLKEPVRSIHQTIYFLEQAVESADTAEIGRRIDAMRRISRQMDDLIEAILRMSRVGRADLHREAVPVAEIVQEAAELVFGEPRTDVQLSIEELPTWSADFMVLREAFANLLQNAVKYNDSEVKRIRLGTVKLDSLSDPPEEAQGEVAIFVQDNGIGIAKEHWERVFSIFQRLHGKAAYGGGAGAGLTIARKILQRHGGALWVRSEPGMGSTFYLTVGEEDDGR
ncbi:MAG TPA: ATP-binding protein [Pirellulaceae bacterium]|jgi:light-regulated signal transduction histidine kinase (bacteriophytochrome)|nr:ATP-binding protein [Pirellulaceae bacterium]